MTTVSAHLDAARQAAPEVRLPALVMSKRFQLVALLMTDALIITLSIIIAVAARGLLPFAGQPDTESIIKAIGPAIVGGWLLTLVIFETYSQRQLRAGATEYKRVLLATSAMAAAVGITSYLMKYDFPRAAFVLMFTIGSFALLLARLARRRVMGTIRSRGALNTPVVIAGDSAHIDAIAKVLRRESWLGYRVVGAVTNDRLTHTLGGLPVLGNLTETVSVIDRHKASSVIFADGSFESPSEFQRMAWRLEKHKTNMVVVPAITETSAQRLDVRPVAGLPLVDVAPPQALAAARWVKRAFDLIGSALLLLITSPLMLIAALAIKIEDGGPVFFRQVRVGRKGELFECLKFRSMFTDAEQRLDELAHLNEGAGPLFKIVDDPRITRVGRLIRRFSIDELPQFWNTLWGDMSLVGPRPALPTEVAAYDDDTHRRLDVRPGLTGLWQVSGRSDLSWEDAVRLDIYYVDNWSMVQDLMILAKTARAVLLPSGAY
jgi:exopolysaccharide biosynthesis polyprenyl glycosylphosphotransferase